MRDARDVPDRPDVVVAADGLTKTYKVYGTPWDRLGELVTRRPRHRQFHALEGVTFALPRGEGLALIGENGAGKSTLLKILAGITAPTAGAFSVRGKVASILELGSGFHPEFTGRQNVVLNAAMLGLSQEEVRRKMPDILAFSELGEFIDQPVKVYSTGMAMRLGFSIATQVEPDVLIIDEALSVGDGYFQKKCMDRLRVFVQGGGTLLFCSHAMYYVSAFCQRALWLRHGRAEGLGPVADVVRDYENFLVAKSAQAGPPEAPGPAPAALRPSGMPARIAAVRLVEPAAENLYRPGEAWELEVEWETADPSLAFHLGVGINRLDGVEVCSFATHQDGLPPRSAATRYAARLRIPALPLIKGEFTLYIFLLDEEGLHIYDQRVLPNAFTVHSPSYTFGLVRVDHAWELDARRVSSVHRSIAWR
ncbi:MAG TPA: ABC transporter ATP-binding protein [Thermoanaerobaculia bacterium]|jgi:ABC-type polysaccharide/polyol phosphate transport system ATPase subunit|nr:ABC transporter ATP-binding protein [Thermoanaerobaculia bacterium]